ncbi:hypothetical protein DFH07DRAFT_998723 [Mycena maculata]|uniref:Uncharacterized protein n=1 Tax=Mycena maculata TaxID=230809 RepID=A0AAD7HW59_9AGAR|nr:hypothetical protein DFH07DRAFT_998723 [Mycena maculata]
MSTRPIVFVCFQPLDEIRASTTDLPLFPIQLFSKTAIGADHYTYQHAHLESVANQTARGLADVISLFKSTSVAPATLRIQNAAATTACRHEIYHRLDSDSQLAQLRSILDQTWATKPPPDVVIFLGPRKSPEPVQPILSAAPSMQPEAIVGTFLPSPYAQGSPWHQDWEPTIEDPFPTASFFHIRSAITQSLVFVPGYAVSASYMASFPTSRSIAAYVKASLFHELIHITRTDLFGIEHLAPPRPRLEGDTKPPAKYGEAGAEAEVLAFGAIVGIYHLDSIGEVQGSYYDPKVNTDFFVSPDRMEDLFVTEDSPLSRLSLPALVNGPALFAPSQHLPPLLIRNRVVRLSVPERSPSPEALPPDATFVSGHDCIVRSNRN